MRIRKIFGGRAVALASSAFCFAMIAGVSSPASSQQQDANPPAANDAPIGLAPSFATDADPDKQYENVNGGPILGQGGGVKAGQ